MKQLLIFVLLLFAVVSCNTDDDNTGTITIVPLGNYELSNIKINRGSDDTNYANPNTIYSSTSYDVPPGHYYVYLHYENLDTGVDGWWQTTSDTQFDVATGDEWVIEYGYFGGDISKH